MIEGRTRLFELRLDLFVHVPSLIRVRIVQRHEPGSRLAQSAGHQHLVSQPGAGGVVFVAQPRVFAGQVEGLFRPSQNQVKCLQSLREKFAALDPKERKALRPVLERTGCWEHLEPK